MVEIIYFLWIILGSKLKHKMEVQIQANEQFKFPELHIHNKLTS